MSRRTDRRSVLRAVPAFLFGLSAASVPTSAKQSDLAELTGSSFTRETKLGADDSRDFFGASAAVSKDGTTALVGAYQDEQNGTTTGTVRVFERTSGSWSQQDRLTAGDGDTDDRFGTVAVSDDGTTAVIGALGDEDPNGRGAGSAYVFTASSGSWSKQEKLTPTDGDSGDAFGDAVAVSGDGTTVVVSASGDEDPNGRGAGAVYVFGQSSGSWSQQTKLTPKNGDDSDSFGTAVAVSEDGTTVLIGASSDEDPNGRGAGAAYVFEQSSGSWSQQTRLTPTDGDGSDSFGESVGLAGDGTTAVLGASGDEDPNGSRAGAAYIFTASSGSWSQQTRLTPTDGDPEDGFGGAVALSTDGTTAVLGASSDEDPNGRGAGAAYVFEQSSGSWSQQEKLTPTDGDSDDAFGTAVAVSGDGTTTVVGAEADEDPGGSFGGSAYIFRSATENGGLSIDSVRVENQYESNAVASIPARETVQGETITVTATVTNNGSSTVTETINYTFDTGRATGSVTVNSLPAGASKTVYVTLKVGTLSPGTYTHTFTSSTTTASATADLSVYELGDVSHSGGIGPGEATKIQKDVVGMTPSGTYNPAAADMNADKTVGPGDVTLLQKKIVGLFSPSTIQTQVLDTGTR